MSKRVQIIEKKIRNIEEIINKAGSITKALDDEIAFKPAILMHLVS